MVYYTPPNRRDDTFFILALLYFCTYCLRFTCHTTHTPHHMSQVFFFLSLPKRVQTWLIAVNGVYCCQRHNILLVQGPVQIYISVLDGWGPLRIGLGTTWGLFPCHFPALWGLQVSTCSDTTHTPHIIPFLKKKTAKKRNSVKKKKRSWKFETFGSILT